MDSGPAPSGASRNDGLIGFHFARRANQSVCSFISLSSLAAKNILLAPSGKSDALIRTSRAERGALANVINAARDAVDADALLTNSARRGRRSRVVLTPRRWRQVSRDVFREATVAKEPGHRGEHEGNR